MGRLLTHFGVALLVALMVTGCGSKKALTTTTTLPAVAVTSTTFAPQTTLSTVAQNQITANLTEFNIALSQSVFAPGAYTLITKNSGTKSHGFAIAGPGGVDQQTASLEPGQSAQLSLRLQAGMYDVWSPVANDKAQGMVAKLTVGTIGHGAGS